MRKARVEDIKKINNIVEDAKISLKNDGVDQWQNSSPDMFLLRRQISKDRAYVLEDKEILAYAYLSEEYEPSYGPVKSIMRGRNYYTIHTFCLGKDVRGKGIASKFFNQIIALSKKENKDSLYIDTHRDNFRMRGLIEKMGFSYLGIIYINDNGLVKERLAYELMLWLIKLKKKL